MSATVHYTVILEREEDGGYHAFVPALKGCHSQGETLEDTIENVREAISVYLESLKAHGENAPIEDILIKPVEVRHDTAFPGYYGNTTGASRREFGVLMGCYRMGQARSSSEQYCHLNSLSTNYQ